MSKIILSHFQAKKILDAINEKKQDCSVSLDLGITTTLLSLSNNSVVFPDGQTLTYKQLKKILKHENKCYFVEDNDLRAVNIFSETTEWMRTLYPTESAPTTLVSGFLMHRIKQTNPLIDTKQKVAALGKIEGGVILDTCFGLGYTAIELSKVGTVFSVELDPGAVELAKMNPWSSPLFSNPNIEVHIGDIRETIVSLAGGSFSHVLHDPPSFRIADELYEQSFYLQLYRVLRQGGVLFHYIGDPESPLGSQVTKRVIERLRSVGFKQIVIVPNTFGVVATK